ncbi:TniQ family protein [Noviherbaspirillum agri]
MFKVADTWQYEFEDLPARSRLVSLKPIGHGTIWQEALSSYFIRLARAHTCAPLVLLNKEVLPRSGIQHSKSSGSFVYEHLKTMNGVGKYAGAFVSRLEQLTLQSGLQKCTFLPWVDIFAPNATGLLHTHPHWCCDCFNEWRKEGVEPYFPLIWMAGAVEICPKHGTLLANTCSHCGKRQPFIHKHTYLDHCSFCSRSLCGTPDYVATNAGDRSELLQFQVEVIREMIEHAPSVGLIATLSEFQGQLRKMADDHFSGSILEFERSIGFREKSVVKWFKNQARPSLPLLMQMCYRLDTTLLSFVRNGVERNLEHDDRPFETASVCKRYKASAAKLVEIRTTLQKIIASGKSNRPMRQIADELDVPYTYVKYWFNDECELISEFYRQYRRAEAIKKREENVAKAKEVVLALHRNRVKVTRRVIDLRLQEHGIYLSRPEIREAVREAQLFVCRN